ncbi:MAG: manganese catalase family protein, partial [Faecousia sp.]
MFVYEKKLQYPVKIARPNPKLAGIVLTQYGGRYTNRLTLWVKIKPR